MFYICHSENPSNIMKIIFNSISIYSWKKISLLANIRNKHVTRKINLYFFDVMKKAIFFLQKFVIFNMITDSFLGEKWGTLERTSKNEETFGKSVSFPCTVKCFSTSNVSYLVLCHFSLHIKKYIFHYFL